MTEIRPRVTGTEMEWPVGLLVSGNDEFQHANGDDIRKITSQVSKYAPHYNGFMPNGARCYEDCDLLEYCTGEEDTFIGTVAAEMAGERIVRQAVQKFVDKVNWIEDGRLLKRVYHGHNISCGYHVNLCADARTVEPNGKSLYYLGLWAATVSMYTGAGCMYETSNGSAQFAIAQKSLGTMQGFDDFTTDQYKPLVCLRDEPLADDSRFTRVQIVGLDPNISPWASWMTLGTASLILRAIEQGRDTKKNLELEDRRTGSSAFDLDPIAALARSVARKPELDAKTIRHGGKSITAIGIQNQLYKMCEKTEHTDEEAKVLENWKTVLDSMNGDRKFLHQKSGWAVKRRQLQHYATRRSMDFDDSRMLGVDRSYDENREGGMADKLREKIWSEDMPPAEMIEHRMENPCPNTRASLRGAEILKHANYSLSAIGWDHASQYNEPTVYFEDPLMTKLPAVNLTPKSSNYD